MSKQIFKSAVDDIKPSSKLIDETAKKMMLAQQSTRRRPLLKRYMFASSLAVVIFGTMMILWFWNQGEVTDHPLNSHAFDPSVDLSGEIRDDYAHPPDKTPTEPLPQITNHYVPFQATEYEPVKMLAPNIPFYYDELKQISEIIILCTISDIGVYRNKEEQYHPKASLGTYIYTVNIDQILSGNIVETAGSMIPVAELAWAKPKFEENGTVISEWRFSPYTGRAEEARILEKGKQYVMFLSQKDATGAYGLSFNGFGVFPVDYMERESLQSTLSDLEEQYTYVEEVSRSPMENDLLFRLSSLYVKEEFFQNK